jgi:release factor glutamine methyltransferase
LISVSRAIGAALGVLSLAGVASPRADAELLAAHVLGVPRGLLVLTSGMNQEQVGRFRALVAARADRVPLQHLLGTAAFRELELAVGPGVFVPRPETEMLVEWGLAVLPPRAPVVVDLCAGSGAIALAVAHERRDARVYAVERDPAALQWLRRNAADRVAAGDPPVRVVAGDAADPAVLSTLDRSVDLVLANPPYVPDAAPVGPEVAGHDPAVAVFAGPDGLDTISALVPRVAALLRPGGWFGVEHDDTQDRAVPALLRADGRFEAVADHRDLAGRPRFTVARLLADCTT